MKILTLPTMVIFLTKMIAWTVTMKRLDLVQRSLAWLQPVNSLLAIPVIAIRLTDVATHHT